MEVVYRGLKGRRFLIVIDDVWSADTWDHMQRIFPNDGNKSRILLTTRLKYVADYVSCPDFPPHSKSFLSQEDSWNLFTEKIFQKDPCPALLEEIGKHIVHQCRGLPLSIVVVARLLRKMDPTHDNWKRVEGNMNSILWLWIAEKFIRARSVKRLEVVAEEYVEELTDRSLILVGTRRANGRMKTCKIHDLRQLCIREAKAGNALYALIWDTPCS
ncbi:hypothetical protein P3S67_026353 [Capsicum chacoense]